MTVLVFFIFLQITDALFTFYGIRAVGVDNYEGNPLMAFSMHHLGVMQTIFLAKVMAILLSCVLYKWRSFFLIWFLNGIYFWNLVGQIRVFLVHRS